MALGRDKTISVQIGRRAIQVHPLIVHVEYVRVFAAAGFELLAQAFFQGVSQRGNVTERIANAGKPKWAEYSGNGATP